MSHSSSPSPRQCLSHPSIIHVLPHPSSYLLYFPSPRQSISITRKGMARVKTHGSITRSFADRSVRPCNSITLQRTSVLRVALTTFLESDPRELEVDPRTGMKNYIANGSFLVFLTWVHHCSVLHALTTTRIGPLGYLQGTRETYTGAMRPYWQASSLSREEARRI